MLLAAAAFAHTPHDTVVDAAGGFAVIEADGASLLLRRDGDHWEMVGGEPTAEVLLGAVHSATRLWSFDGEWHATEFPAEMSVANERLWGGPAGLWVDGVKVLDDAIVDVGDGVAVLADGRVWHDGGLLSFPEAARVAVPGYAAGATGAWRFDSSPCAALAVTRLATDGAVLLAATDEGAPWLSTDGCATWEDRRAPLPVSTGRMGDAPAGAVFSALEVDGDAWTVAGWEGIATTDDAGATWFVPPLVSAIHTRGLRAADGCIQVGAYGAGVLRTCDGGRTFSADNADLTDPNVQRMAGEYIVAGHHLWCSTDDAASWQRVDTPVEEVVGVWPLSQLWIAGTREEGVWVRDGDWRRVPELEEGTLRGMAEIDGRVCGATRDPVRVICDGELLYEAEGDTVAGPVDDGGLVWGDSLGIHRGDTVEDLGEPVTVLIPGAAATRGGRVVTGGSDVRLPAQIYTLLEVDEGVLAGTHDGVFLVRDGVAERWGALERVDDRSPMLECPGCELVYGRADAAMSSMQPLGQASTWVRGTEIRVSGAGDLDVTIDGEPAGCGRSWPVEPGWHAVEVQGTGMLDAVEGWTPGPVLGGSRCADGGSALVLVWALRRRRRPRGS